MAVTGSKEKFKAPANVARIEFVRNRELDRAGQLLEKERQMFLKWLMAGSGSTACFSTSFREKIPSRT